MSNKIQHLINRNDISKILDEMFTVDQDNTPILRVGYYNERQLWDFKEEVPDFGKAHLSAWAVIAKHVLALHNAKGGILFFGIRDADFKFVGARNFCDSARFNNAIRKYVGDLFHVIFSREYL